jgi:hypothetical protein
VPPTAAFSSTVSLSPATVARGDSVAIAATVGSRATLGAMVQVVVADVNGRMLFQQSWDGQSFTAGQKRTYSVTWSVPRARPKGAYTVSVGVFSVGGGTLYNWNNAAGAIVVN